MDGDPNAALDSVWDVVEIVQIADFPGHVEIGGGGVPLENFILSVMRRGYGGLLELEHRWSAEGPAVETDYLRRLASLDKRARLSVI
jgi:hydroxypyruvate isomerase